MGLGREEEGDVGKGEMLFPDVCAPLCSMLKGRQGGGELRFGRDSFII